MRQLDQEKVTPLAGTEGGWDPFFSPDGKWLGFFAGTKLRKISVEGGVPVTLCDAPNGRGGSWGDDGYIVAALDITGGLSKVSANGGRPERVTGVRGEVDDGTSHRWPQVLTDGEGILFTSMSGQQTSVEALPRGSVRSHLLVRNARNGRYLRSGHLVYYAESSTIAVPMDPARLVPAGPGATLVPKVARFFNRAAFDISQTGTLVYVRGMPEDQRIVCWLNSSGGMEPLLLKPDRYLTPRLSPDAKRLAITIEKRDGANVWVYDLQRDTMEPLPAAGDYQSNAIWMPDGEHLVLQSAGKLAWTRADGSGRIEQIRDTRQAFPYSFSSDGGKLFFHQTTDGSYELWEVTVDSSGPRFGRPERLTDGRNTESCPAVSPNGKWLAYTTLIQAVRPEVVVVALRPDGTLGNRKWQVSNQSGMEPIWAKNGRELFYRQPRGEIHVLSYDERNDVLLPRKPRLWSKRRTSAGTGQSAYDLAADGKRVVALCDVDGQAKAETHLRVVMNFGAEVQGRVASGIGGSIQSLRKI
jgi:serine/threonine-protein kinase